MPILDLKPYEVFGGNLVACVVPVVALTLYPGDPHRQEEVLAWTVMNTLARLEQHREDELVRQVLTDMQTPTFWRALQRTSARGDFLTEFDRAKMRGALAGRILCWVLRLQALGLEGSLNKARYLTIEECRGIPNPLRIPLPLNDAILRAIWQQYACVSPFWAAQNDPEDRLSPDMTTENFLRFLASAKEYARLGLHHKSTRSRDFLLTAETLWVVQCSFPIPGVTFSFAPLDQIEHQWLARYRRP